MFMRGIKVMKRFKANINQSGRQTIIPIFANTAYFDKIYAIKSQRLTVPLSSYSFFTEKKLSPEEFEDKIREKIEAVSQQMNWDLEGAKHKVEGIEQECKEFYKSDKFPNWYEYKMIIAYCSMNMGNLEKAQPVYEEIISELNKVSLTENDYQVLADALLNLAAINVAQGKLEKALEHERKACDIIKDNFSDDAHNKSQALSHYHIGQYLLLQSKIQEAIVSLEESLRILENLFQTVTTEEDKKSLIPDLCNVYDRLGEIHMSLKNIDQCKNYFKSAIGLLTHIQDENHPMFSKFYINFATLNISDMEWDEALSNLKKAKNILDMTDKSEENLHLEISFNTVYSDFHNQRGEYEEALNYVNLNENMISTCKIKDVLLQMQIYPHKAGILYSLGRYNEMEKSLEEGLNLNRKIFSGNENDFSFYALYHFYSILCTNHKMDFQNAIEYAWKAYNVAAYIYGEGNKHCGDSLTVISLAYKLQKKWGEALEYGVKALEIYNKYPDKRTNVQNLMVSLAFILNQSGDKERSLLYLKECKNLMIEDLAKAPEPHQKFINMKIDEIYLQINQTENDLLQK